MRVIELEDIPINELYVYNSFTGKIKHLVLSEMALYSTDHWRNDAGIQAATSYQNLCVFINPNSTYNKISIYCSAIPIPISSLPESIKNLLIFI